MKIETKAHMFFTVLVGGAGIVSEVGVGITFVAVVIFNLMMVQSFAEQKEKDDARTNTKD